MADIVGSRKRSEMMSRIQGRDTTPEIIVRRIAHSLGFRFRLYRKDLPGRPDLVFPRYRTVVFVHGCFLAQTPRVSVCLHPQDQREVLDGEIQPERCTGPPKRGDIGPSRMAGPGYLGVRDAQSGVCGKISP